MTDQPLYSIIMPAYNEEDVIADTVDDLCSHLNEQGFHYELIIVDDASADGTAGEIARLKARHPEIIALRNDGPNGYGFAIRRGLGIYRGEAAVVVTSDGSDAPKDVATYFNKIAEGFDCVLGSRFAKGAVVTGYPRFKLLVNRLANVILSWIVGQPYRDYTNGFKCYRREVIDDMAPLITGQFNITIEMSLKAILAGHSYTVVPTDWRQRDAGQSSFNIFRMMRPYYSTMVYCLARQYLLGIRR
ncbi:MAG: glycosyltransferase family 2 protein [Marinibacterium sp.]